MKKPGYSFKTDLVYGLMVIVPFGVLVLLIAKVVEILQTVALSLKLESAVSAGFAIVIALLLLLLVCLAIGTMVRTEIGPWSFEKPEQAILRRVPGCEFLGNILKGFVTARDPTRPSCRILRSGPAEALPRSARLVGLEISPTI